MAIRLTFDVIGSTCGDLLRFADAVRAAGARPEQPLHQSSGPNRIDVVVDDKAGPAPWPGGPLPVPPHGPGGLPGVPIMRGHPGGAGFVMSGSFPPAYNPHGERRIGGHISVHWGPRSRETQVSIETVDRWKAALDTVLQSATVDESVRASLRSLREAFNDQGMPPDHQGGS